MTTTPDDDRLHETDSDGMVAGEDDASGAVDGDYLPVAQEGGSDTGRDDAGDPELAGDDRSVAGDATAVGDQRRRTA